MDRFYRATGVFGVALLALTACGDSGEGGDDYPEDNAPEGVDPSGAEQQGNYSDEIAGEEGDNVASPVPDDETMDPPALNEIIDQIWETSAEQDSVTINVAVTAEALEQAQENLGGTQEEGDLPHVEDTEDEAEDVQLTIAGDLNGEGSTYTQEGGGEYLVFDEGEQYLQTVDTFVSDYQADAEAQGVTAEIAPEDLRDALSAEGDWIEVTPTHAERVETPAQFLENFRNGYGFISGGSEIGDLSAEGEVETRDGENVWVYAEGGYELVVLADESEPLLMAIAVEDGGVQVDFSDWNETDAPERPEDDTIIFADELEAIIQPLVQ